MSAYSSSGKYFAKTLYAFNNVPISSTGSTGSGEIDVTPHNTKSAYAYISGSAVSGSLIVSGSFDRTNWYTWKSGSFNSGSISYFTFTDAIPLITVNIHNHYTGSVSGSLWLVGA